MMSDPASRRLNTVVDAPVALSAFADWFEARNAAKVAAGTPVASSDETFPARIRALTPRATVRDLANLCSKLETMSGHFGLVQPEASSVCLRTARAISDSLALHS